MRVNDVVRLDREPQPIDDFVTYLAQRAAGRSVLDIGVAGGVQRYLPDQTDQWLHARLKSVAADIFALDIDQDGIAYAARHGWTIHHGDCQTAQLGRSFDMAVMMEVIEHVESPAAAISNIFKHLAPGGQLYLTSPNPTFLGDIFRTLRGRPMSIYWDHVALFAPEHIQALCDRHGFELSEVKLFCPRDQRTPINRVKSAVMAGLARLNPRLSTSWLGVIRMKQQ